MIYSLLSFRCKEFLLFCTLALPVLFTNAQSHRADTVYWEGSLDLGSLHLPISLREIKTEDTVFLSMGSPAQTSEWFPVSKQKRPQDSLLFTIKPMNIVYRGKFNESKDQIQGTFKQQLLKKDLTFIQTHTVFKPRRPQTPPSDNLPYETEEIVFQSNVNYNFHGTLSFPRGGGKYPAVILITGSGLQDRDETIMEHKPFAVLADTLTREGFVVLRYDDRGWGTNDSLLLNGTSFDFKDDVLAAYRFLQTQPQVIPHKISLIGHSEGGMIAAMVAAEEKNIAAVVMMAGTGVKGEDILISQTQAILASQNVPQNIIEETLAKNKKIYAIITQDIPRAEKEVLLRTLLKNWWDSLSPEEQKASQTDQESFIKQLLTQSFSPWMETFIALDPAPFLKKVTQPILVLNGDRDLQVLPDLNLPAIEASLQQGGNTRYKIKRYENMNHLFQKCNTCSLDEYTLLEETLNPRVLTDIIRFLKKHLLP